MQNEFDVAIIGAGPAGISAAIFAAEKGKKVVLLEKNSQIGRKILATGNGRCNITNRNIEVDRYHSTDQNFVAEILKKFNQTETMEFFESLGLILKEEDRGRVFPRTNQASSVVSALNHKLIESNVHILTDFVVKEVEKSSFWDLTSADGRVIRASKLIIATGGKAAHHLGSSGDGLYWAKKLGHTVSPIYAALVPVETAEEWPAEVQGIKVEANVKVMFDDKEVSNRSGDLLFTHFGVSGPAVMSQAGKIAPLLEKGPVLLSIDIFPEINEDKLNQKLTDIFANSGAKAVKNALLGVAPANLLPVILRNAIVDPDKKAAEISKEERKKIIDNIKSMKLSVKKIRPLREAQVTSGGVELSEVNPETLESRIISELYFAGEILNVDGDSGGFNLQWAWSSGFVAGSNAAK